MYSSLLTWVAHGANSDEWTCKQGLRHDD